MSSPRSRSLPLRSLPNELVGLVVCVTLIGVLPGAALGGGVQPASSPPTPRGIDVSHHSGEIDWSKVASEGYGFVYVKATEGIDNRDPLFEEHWQAIDNAKLLRGAYHFYVTEDDPETQAEFFLSRIEHDPGELPPVVDVEVIGHGTTGDLPAKLRRFLEILEQRLGVVPMIYTSPRFWNTHFDESFGRYPLWVAEYEVDEPTLPKGWSEWHLWQFEGDATVAGVEKSADQSRAQPGLHLPSLGRAGGQR